MQALFSVQGVPNSKRNVRIVSNVNAKKISLDDAVINKTFITLLVMARASVMVLSFFFLFR